MRNEERIPEVLNAIEAYWYEHPDLRLGQLIDNLADRNTFAIEDDELMRQLDDELSCEYFIGDVADEFVGIDREDEL
jgi:uncharacterized protein YihD (DUF1040 family)